MQTFLGVVSVRVGLFRVLHSGDHHAIQSHRPLYSVLESFHDKHIYFFNLFMTNLDSIFKSRDITLPTKVRLVKAMVFPVVVYGCESWTVKKVECQRINVLNCGVGEDS